MRSRDQGKPIDRFCKTKRQRYRQVRQTSRTGLKAKGKPVGQAWRPKTERTTGWDPRVFSLLPVDRFMKTRRQVSSDTVSPARKFKPKRERSAFNAPTAPRWVGEELKTQIQLWGEEKHKNWLSKFKRDKLPKIFPIIPPCAQYFAQLLELCS